MFKSIVGCVGVVLLGCLGACTVTSEDGDTSDSDLTASEGEVWLSEWKNEDRKAWYLTPQGSHMIEFDVFMALEQPRRVELFSQQEHMESFGFLYPPESAKALFTRDGLPLGMLKDTKTLKGAYDDEKPGEYVGLNCAACHTGEIKTKDADGKAHRWLVDAGQGALDYDAFVARLQEALAAAVDVKAKNTRICQRIGASCAERLANAKSRVDGYMQRNVVKVQGGPGRVDAISRILNELMGHHYRSPGDVAPAGAPVSYPPVWDAPRLSCVQTNCLSNNPLNRNTGEVLGVFGESMIDGKMKYGDAQIEGPKVVGTPKIDNVHKLEGSLRSYTSPKWRSELGKLDTAKMTRGDAIYGERCASCHTRPFNHDLKKLTGSSNSEDKKNLEANFEKEEESDGSTQWLPKVVRTPYKKVGTDAAFMEDNAARFSANPEANSVLDSLLQRRAAERNQISSNLLISGVVLKDKTLQLVAGLRKTDGSTSLLLLLGATTASLADARFEPPTNDAAERKKLLAQRISFQENRSAPPPRDFASYRARPLNGIAFTAPFFHNGSCPTLLCVLDQKERAANKSFVVRLGSFDTTKVGLDTSAEVSGEHLFRFDTSIRGNGNAGHTGPEFGGDLPMDDKMALIEYLKSL